MIVSASRRTDIPAFFSDWFLNRLQEGYVLVRNPVKPSLVGKVTLEAGALDCIVFWTKDPQAMMGKLDRLEAYHYYFLFTITSYGNDLERNLRPKESIIETFIDLSRTIGKERVIWRYDPILLSDRIDPAYHYEHFAYLARRLESYTDQCIISFLDMYHKCKRNLAGFSIKMPDDNEMSNMAGRLCAIARRHHMTMTACAEEIDLAGVGVELARCIDDRLVNTISGKSLDIPKDKHQRKTCNCVESIDIGAYNTCAHHCLYCYANANQQVVTQNMTQHDPHSPLLFGQLTPHDKIVERKTAPSPPKQCISISRA